MFSLITSSFRIFASMFMKEAFRCFSSLMKREENETWTSERMFLLWSQHVCLIFISEWWSAWQEGWQSLLPGGSYNHAGFKSTGLLSPPSGMPVSLQSWVNLWESQGGEVGKKHATTNRPVLYEKSESWNIGIVPIFHMKFRNSSNISWPFWA